MLEAFDIGEAVDRRVPGHAIEMRLQDRPGRIGQGGVLDPGHAEIRSITLR